MDSTDGKENHSVLRNNLEWECPESYDDVKNKEIYEPFDWFNRPPSVHRLMGIKWLGYHLYPDVCQTDLKEEADDEMDKFLERSVAGYE